MFVIKFAVGFSRSLTPDTLTESLGEDFAAILERFLCHTFVL